MATYKGTYLFNQGRYGWSESWYVDAATITDAAGYFSGVMTQRIKMLGRGARMEMIRVSDVDIAGDSMIVLAPEDQITAATPVDTPWNCLLVRVESGALYRRSMWMRGAPDEWMLFSQNGSIIIPTDAKNALKAWSTKIINAGFKFKVTQKGGPETLPLPIGALAEDENGRVVAQIPGFAGQVNDFVQFKGYNGPDKKILNGRHRVVKVDGASVTVGIEFNTLFAPNANFGGKAVRKITLYTFVTSAFIERATSRRTGRAFFVRPGRSSGK